MTLVCNSQKLWFYKGKTMKDGYFIDSVIFGNTEVELRGYNGEIKYAYIGDQDITEMAYELDLWPQIEDELYAQKA